ncbi:MAG: glycogen/starch synthase [Dehalococcoidia bacterium]|nr:glycogen/starch synthase [Dehalococcoidia bacterium]
MSKKLKILFAAAEVSPFTKVGGLADVAGALPKALQRLGHDVRVVTPRYGGTRDNGAATRITDRPFGVPALGETEEVTVSHSSLNGGVPVYFLENQKYFERPAVYGEPDDLARFTLFSRALLEVPRLLGWQPDILHCHDWHAASAVAFLGKDKDPWYRSTASVFTIHNLAYQGWFDDHFEERAGFAKYTQDLDNACGRQFNSMMSMALFYADIVSTVSEQYAREILTKEYGEGLDSLLRHRQVKPCGIVNGIDYEEFDPAKDTRIAATYDSSTPERKVLNKTALRKRLGLPASKNRPLIGMVGRLAAQKGIDIVAPIVRDLAQQAQLVILGSGQPEFERKIKEAVALFPRAARLVMGFDAGLAQLIYAGSDIYLMPSRFEPCGLGQLIAMRYGTIPLVRHTGGLVDTVRDCDDDLSHGNGFVFRRYASKDLVEAAGRAVTAFRTQKEAWRQLVVRDMAADYSWEASARKYEAMYLEALKLKASAPSRR